MWFGIANFKRGTTTVHESLRKMTQNFDLTLIKKIAQMDPKLIFLLITQEKKQTLLLF